MLVRLIYASIADATLTAAGVARLVEEARAYNRLQDITGILVSDGRMFLQSLEGEREAVCLLLASIQADHRHHSVTLIGFRDVRERAWLSSALHYVPLPKSRSSIFRRYSVQSVFNPYLLTADAAQRFLAEMQWIVQSPDHEAG
jgi:hypothetical protein